MKALFSLATAAAAAALLAACASPGTIAPQARLRTPAEAGLVPAAPAVSTADAVAAPASEWWRAFDDTTLDALVDRSLAENPNLKVAQARIARAAALQAGAEAAERPSVDGSVELTRQHYTENGLYPPPFGGSTLNSGNVQATLQWQLDFFGRNRAQIAAALGNERAAEAEAASARVTLASTVARRYVALARLFAQRAVAERSLAQRQEVLALTQQRVGAGLDTNVELRQSEGSLPDTRGQIEALDEQIALARHELAVLSGQAPNALDGLVPTLATLQSNGRQPLPAALPVDLLARRPDVNAARWRVEASMQNVAVARTEFYPNINLTAFFGFNAFGLDKLLDGNSRNYGAGPAIHLPLFDAGRLRANLRGQAADADAAIESYNDAVLQAVREAADQVSSLQSLARQQAEQARAEAAAESAYDLAVQRYRAGIGTYLVVLAAETNVLAQRRNEVDLAARAIDARIALTRALGGGYTEQDAPLAAAGSPAVR